MPLRRVQVEPGATHEALAIIGGRSIDVGDDTMARVREIVASVRARGDAAVAQWTREIEGREPRFPPSYEIPHDELVRARSELSPEILSALYRAAQRIRNFHEEQVEPAYSIADGALSLRIEPLARVGLYVPGGTALYPSSVLMTAIPAVVAGVGEIIMVTPGASRETLAAAAVAGIGRVFEIGGAQAVAALAYGTETIPRVDKIVGPGNQWVAAAKREVFGDVDIDSIAGPSEILIIADDSANPAWVAADLLAQAEHDREARAVLVTTSTALADAVDREVDRQLADLPRKAIAGASIADHGVAFVCARLEDAIHLANEHAPEHLEVLTENAETVAARLHTAGAIFVGPFSPEAAGDYLAGPNHVLPTGGAARYASPLGVYDFRKRISVLAQPAQLLEEEHEDIARLARVEELEGHARSVEIRFAEEHRAWREPRPLGSEEGSGPVSRTTYGRRTTSSHEAVRPESLADRLMRPGLESIEPYRVAHPEGIRVLLHANEMPFALPNAVADGLHQALAHAALHRYPDARAGELRSALAQWMASHRGVAIDGERLVLGNGSDELITLLCSTFARPRDGAAYASIVYPTPTFSVFRVAAITAGCEPVEVPLTSRFELDESALDVSIHGHRPNLVFFARPNNPTGTLWQRKSILALAARHRGTLFVVDEAYIDYGGDSMIGDAADNVIVMGTLSKIGLATARVGYIYGDGDLMFALERARSPYNIGGLNQIAASYLLAEHGEWIAERCAEIAGERERVRGEIEKFPGVEVLPSSANLLLLRLGDGAVGRGHALWQALAEGGVLVRDLDKAGPLAGCVRVTIGTKDDNDAFLQAFSTALHG